MSLVTQFGEAFIGEGAEAAHLNTVLGAVGGPVETAWVTALATPREGHAAFVVAGEPGLAVQPFTLFVNKATIAGERHGAITWGAAQAGVAGGVLDALSDSTIDAALVHELLLIAAVWVNPAATDEHAVYVNNREATRLALAAGREARPCVEDAMAARAEPWNAYFRAVGSPI